MLVQMMILVINVSISEMMSNRTNDSVYGCLDADTMRRDEIRSSFRCGRMNENKTLETFRAFDLIT